MSTPIKINKGLKANLPTSIVDGQINFCTDTGELYIDDTTKRTIMSSAYYGKTETNKATSTKIINIVGFSLKPGVRIIIEFANGNSASSPKLNINNTGAKNIAYTGTDSLELLQGVLYDFVYDGTKYILIGNSSGIATKTTNDKDGNEITATYATKEELSNMTSVIIRRWTE